MRQTRLPVIYSFLFVTVVHLVSLMMLWISHSADLKLPLASVSAMRAVTTTLLSAAPQPLHKPIQQQTPRQVAHIKHPATPSLIQKKITPATVIPPPISNLTRSSSSSELSTLPASSATSATLTNELASATSPLPRSVRHLDCRIAQPHYPVLSRQRGESGITLIKMIVSAYGVIEQATVIQSSGSNRLDYAARAAALTSTCHPYQLNGQPLRAAVNLRFKFSLHD